MFQSYALFPHLSDLRERRLRAAAPRRQADVKAKAQRRRWSWSSWATLGSPQADPALRRPAAARRAGPGPGQPPRGAAARRAARRARPQAAPPDADRAQAHPDRGRPHLHPRHPRPGGGHDHGRHHRGDERGPHRAARRPGRRCTSCPRTTFVANFLGQSNLVARHGHRTADGGHARRRRARRSEILDARRRARVPRRRRAGRRAARRRCGARATSRPAPATTLARASSPTCRSPASPRSTWCEMPWGCDVERASQQNLDGERAGRGPATTVVAGLGPGPHVRASTPRRAPRRRATRRLDVDGVSSRSVAGAGHGARRRRAAARPNGGRAVPAAAARACSGWSSSSSLPLMHAGVAVACRSRSPVDAGYYYRDLATSPNYADALTEVLAAVLRSFCYAGTATVARAAARPTRWRTPSRSRPGAGSNVMLVLRHRAVLHQLSCRTLAWKHDPGRRRARSRSSSAALTCTCSSPAPDRQRPLLTSPFAVVAA